MVDTLIGKEPYLIEGFGDELLLAPIDVPIIIVSLLILAAEQRLLDAVREEGLELYLRTESNMCY
jgi:hypothetical protein